MAAKPLTEITPYGKPRLEVHILVPHTRCRHGDVSHVIYHKGRQLLVWPYAVASVGIIFRAADLSPAAPSRYSLIARRNAGANNSLNG